MRAIAFGKGENILQRRKRLENKIIQNSIML
jgi:hypothetical protein